MRKFQIDFCLQLYESLYGDETMYKMGIVIGFAWAINRFLITFF
jgi:hypothetical protein